MPMEDNEQKGRDAVSAERRRVTLNCRLTETESRRLKEIAARRGETVTETVLRATVYADESPAPYAAELKDAYTALTGVLFALGRIGDTAETIARDRRSLIARDAVETLKELTDAGVAADVAAAARMAADAIGKTTLMRR